MKTVFPPHTPVTWPVEGRAEGFPVRRVFCVGKNYADHVAEMGGDVKRSEPVIFIKDAHCLVASGAEIAFPPATDDLHHEVELVVAMGPGGVWGHAVGLDMTRRDLQARFKAKGGPWDRAKAFADSAPLGAFREGALVDGTEITLTVNGEVRQRSEIAKMIWGVGEIVDYLRADMGLGAGDLVFTGTPAGVGAVKRGDELVAEVTGLPGLRVRYL